MFKFTSRHHAANHGRSLYAYLEHKPTPEHPMTVPVTPHQHCRSSESCNRPCRSTVGPLELVQANLLLQTATIVETAAWIKP
jgi:hypothetical protein